MKITKGYHGKFIEQTEKNVNGYDWRIHTSKRKSKIVCSAQAGKSSGNMFQCGLFTDPSIILFQSEPGKRATDKMLIEIHTKGLLKFDELKEKGDLPKNKNDNPAEYEIKTGQILWLNGYGQSKYSHERKAIYKIEKGRFGNHYHCVNLDTLALSVQTHIKNDKNIFGIGTYYTENDIIDQETLQNALIDAKQKEKKDNELKEENRIKAEKERKEKIEIGKKIVRIPAWAKSIIIARLEKNESDSMTDYWGSSTIDLLYLSFSKHDRNLFPEMRKAALKSDLTKHLAAAPKEWENKQNYSGGAGYFLGENRYSGWQVRKGWIDISSEQTREKLQIAAAEGKYFCNDPEPSQEVKPIEVKENKDFAKPIIIEAEQKPAKKEETTEVLITERKDKFGRLVLENDFLTIYYNESKKDFCGFDNKTDDHFGTSKKQDLEKAFQSLKSEFYKNTTLEDSMNLLKNKGIKLQVFAID